MTSTPPRRDTHDAETSARVAYPPLATCETSICDVIGRCIAENHGVPENPRRMSNANASRDALGFEGVHWLAPEDVRTIHGRVLTLANITGESTVRSLERVLRRVKERVHLADLPLDVVRIGAAYAYAVTHGHPFIERNERTALVAMATFLRLHGYRVAGIDQPGLEDLMRNVAACHTDEEALYERLAPHVEVVRDEPLPRSGFDPVR